MALTIRNTAPVNYTQDMDNDLLIRINGVLPDLSIMGGEEKSEITVGRTDVAARRRDKR
jgi:hypothetical protein